jgi:hypothetical protein
MVEIMDVGSAMENRRKDLRHRTLKGAKVVFNADSSVIDVTVRDLSSAGARLKVDSAISLPSHFKLLINGETATHSALVRWRNDHEAGIEFDC